MLLLLNQSWPWVVLGSILLVLGFTSIDLTPRQWGEYLLSLPFILSAEQTETEKAETNLPAEEVASANPGCMLVLAGSLMIGFGLFRWLT